jgi:hypothetical protein
MDAAYNNGEYPWMLRPRPKWYGSAIDDIGQDGTGKSIHICRGPVDKQVFAIT